jgi:transposase InsO family protein
MRYEVLRYAHDVRSAGHPGQLRTKLNVLRRFFWPDMSSEVRQYVEACHVCNTQKKSTRTKRAGMKIHHAGFPMERVHVDILGPFIESNKGHRYILVMIDQFTKWVELAPLVEQTAENVTHALIQDFICRMGCASEIFSDQGRNFESSLFHEICAMFQMAKQRTTPYRPSSNGQVERVNREILFKIRAYLDDKQRDWDQYLPFIAMALRATVNESTGYSPNIMMLGRDVTVPLDLLAGPAPPSVESPQPTSDYVEGLQQRLHDVHAFARGQLSAKLEKRKLLYDRSQYQTTYEVGDLVYVINSASKKGQSRKLQSVFCGPYVVTHRYSDILYQVQGRRERDQFVLHHDRLKLCKDRDIPAWLQRKRAQILQNGPPPILDLDDSLHLESLWPDDSKDAPDQTLLNSGGVLPDSTNSDSFMDLGSDPVGPGDPPSPPAESSDPSLPPLHLPGMRSNRGPVPGRQRHMTRPTRLPTWLQDYTQ